jgi:hypothetical protein
MNEPTSNSFRLQVPPEGRDMVLIVSLLYNSNNINNNNTTSTDITKSSPLITGIYKYSTVSAMINNDTPT